MINYRNKKEKSMTKNNKKKKYERNKIRNKKKKKQRPNDEAMKNHE